MKVFVISRSTVASYVNDCLFSPNLVPTHFVCRNAEKNVTGSANIFNETYAHLFLLLRLNLSLMQSAYTHIHTGFLRDAIINLSCPINRNKRLPDDHILPNDITR